MTIMSAGRLRPRRGGGHDPRRRAGRGDAGPRLPPDPDGITEGFAALDSILSLKPQTKVIVATGTARMRARCGVASGAYDYYQKPVDIDQLGLIVRRAFQLHELEEENRRLERKRATGARSWAP
jgi:DNA-binding NtrC family response regulator